MTERVLARMTNEEALEVIGRVDFEPGGDRWEFTLAEDECTDTHLVVELSHYTFDSRTWEMGVEYVDESHYLNRHNQTGQFTITRDLSERQFMKELLEAAVRTVAHEALEFFHFNGVIAHDPHVYGDPEIRIR